jgi:hypothetical protein
MESSSAAGEARAVASLVVQVAAEHRRPPRAQGELALEARLVGDLDLAVAHRRSPVGAAGQDGDLDPGLRASHGARVDAQPARLTIMIPPVSVCHQLSWTGTPSASWPHATTSALSGSATLATKRRCDRS